MYDTKDWYANVLNHMPHGEEGSLECTEDEAIILSKLLIKKGYAVCLTSGDIGDNVKVNWLYAGSDIGLNYADYDMVVFTSIDYLKDYPSAINSELEHEDN